MPRKPLGTAYCRFNFKVGPRDIRIHAVTVNEKKNYKIITTKKEIFTVDL